MEELVEILTFFFLIVFYFIYLFIFIWFFLFIFTFKINLFYLFICLIFLHSTKIDLDLVIQKIPDLQMVAKIDN